MGKYRLENVLAAEAASTAGTKTIDINATDVISRMVIQFKGTNNGATPTAHPAAMISKIELVDGSDILYSESGFGAQAVDYYDTGRMPHTVLDFRNDVMAIATFELNFGRWLWDSELALKPDEFDQLQLKITHNKASGGSAPDVGNLAVWADMFDEKKVSPRGFLQNKEHFSYSLTSSAVQEVNLPTDYILRNVLIKSLSAGKMPHEQFNKVKLVENQGKKTPINDESTSNLVKLFQRHERIVESVEGTGTGSAVGTYCTPSYDAYGVTGAFDAAVTTSYVTQLYGGYGTIAFDNAEHFQSIVQGHNPHGTMEIPFGDQDDMSDWYDVRSFKDLKLKLTAGSAVGSSSTCEVLTQQLRTY